MLPLEGRKRDRGRPLWVALAVVAALGIMAWFYQSFYIYPIDVAEVFLPSARALLRGQSPYDLGLDPGFYGPPWALLPFLPLAGLPDRAAYIGYMVLALLSFAFLFKRLKIAPLNALGAALSLPVVLSLLFGNLEPFCLLGLVWPGPLGMILLAIKPQVGIGVMILWTVLDWQRSGWRGVVLLWTPLAALMLLSMSIFGPWPLLWLEPVRSVWHWNVWSGLPRYANTVSLGIPALLLALVMRDETEALAAGPFLSPYAALHSFSGAILGVARTHGALVWVYTLAMWAVVLTFGHPVG